MFVIYTLWELHGEDRLLTALKTYKGVLETSAIFLCVVHTARTHVVDMLLNGGVSLNYCCSL